MKVKIEEAEGKTVLEYLREKALPISAPCGGKGTCGKCKVKVSGKTPPLEEFEKSLLGQKGVEEGYRLACKLPCQEDMEVEVLEQEDAFYVVAAYDDEAPKPKGEVSKGGIDRYGITIDIGTTTLALELIELETCQTQAVYTSLNSGRKYGADVISRIDYATQYGVKTLQHVMQADLLKGIEWLCQKQGLLLTCIEHVVIVGNTTMLHILMGADCKNLGIYPFEAVFLDKVHITLSELLGRPDFKGMATLLPGISTYVGADLVSGIFKCNLHQKDKVSMLIDIGTNGEMVIGNRKKLLSLATAAGPAFEGGNMSCGIGSVSGAICGAVYDEGKFQVTTIGDEEAVGICGSGFIDVIAEALNHGLIDDTGLIEEELDELLVSKAHDIVLTQKDIRHFQLAKSAIRTGVELLMKNYGVGADEVEDVYLAGGFGKFINLENAFQIGLLPKGFQNKVKRVGNTALGGAKKYLCDSTISEADRRIASIKNISHELDLVNDAAFNTYFVEYMLFGEE